MPFVYSITVNLLSVHIIGLVIDSGEQYTYVAAVYQGHALEHRVLPSPLAGARVTDYFKHQLLREDKVVPKDVLYKLKEIHAYVSATNQDAVNNNDTVLAWN